MCINIWLGSAEVKNNKTVAVDKMAECQAQVQYPKLPNVLYTFDLLMSGPNWSVRIRIGVWMPWNAPLKSR